MVSFRINKIPGNHLRSANLAFRPLQVHSLQQAMLGKLGVFSEVMWCGISRVYCFSVFLNHYFWHISSIIRWIRWISCGRDRPCRNCSIVGVLHTELLGQASKSGVSQSERVPFVGEHAREEDCLAPHCSTLHRCTFFCWNFEIFIPLSTCVSSRF